VRSIRAIQIACGFAALPEGKRIGLRGYVRGRARILPEVVDSQLWRSAELAGGCNCLATGTSVLLRDRNDRFTEFRFELFGVRKWPSFTKA